MDRKMTTVRLLSHGSHITRNLLTTCCREDHFNRPRHYPRVGDPNEDTVTRDWTSELSKHSR